jgi:N-acetylneuraminate lyase
MEGIVGIKYSSNDLAFLAKLLAMRDPEKVNVVSGPDGLFLACFALGVEGAIGTTYNFLPRLYIDIMGAAIRGELGTARRLQYAANTLIKVLWPYGGIPATKAVLTMMGFDVGYCVPPMPTIDGEVAESLRRDMEVAGLFGLLKRNALYGPPGDPMRGKLA